MRRNDSAPAIDDQNSYEKDNYNDSQFDDKKSQISISKQSMGKMSQGAGNGISRAPGADGRKREIAIANALEK
jgi:hypothetical protein